MLHLALFTLIENALVVARWQSVQWHAYTRVGLLVIS